MDVSWRVSCCFRRLGGRHLFNTETPRTQRIQPLIDADPAQPAQAGARTPPEPGGPGPRSLFGAGSAHYVHRASWHDLFVYVR
jgi:hypothetical protein